MVILMKLITKKKIAGNCGKPLYWIHVSTSEAIHQDDYQTPCHHFFPHSTIRLCPCPPSRQGHTCLCLLWEPVYPVQMLLLFSLRHTHLSGPCQGHTTSTLPPVVSPLMLLDYVCQLLDYFFLNACSYCMWTADSLLLHLAGTEWVSDPLSATSIFKHFVVANWSWP